MCGCSHLDAHASHASSFLRDGCLALPAETSDFKYLLELRAEADFYGLTKMTEQVPRLCPAAGLPAHLQQG